MSRPDPPTETDEQALRVLYEAHAPVLLNFLMRLTNGDRQRAEDIVQEALVRAWRHPEARTAVGAEMLS